MTEIQPIQQPSNGAATAAMTMGIIGALVGLVPFFGSFFAIILGVLAVVFGAAGRRRISRGETTRGKGAATAGLVLGVIAVALGIWGLVVFDRFIQDLGSL